MHLGKPQRFYRGFNNLRHSPVSREGLGIAIFIGALGLHILFSLPGNSWSSHSSTARSASTSAPDQRRCGQAIASVFGYLAVLRQRRPACTT